MRAAPLRYPGAKWAVADRIVACFGGHYHYVEPFFGSGAVFFAKAVSPHEVINDVDGRVVNFFRVLRDRTDELCWALDATPWARDEYDLSDTAVGGDYDNGGDGDCLEAARRFVVRVWQAHAGDLSKKTGWRNRGVRQRARGMSDRWQRVPDELAALACRLRNAEIENRPAVDVIGRFNAADCLIYADPPYLPSVRTQKLYSHAMGDEDHEELLDVLCRHRGPVVLSGYDNAMYDRRLRCWDKISLKAPKTEKNSARTETLWVKP